MCGCLKACNFKQICASPMRQCTTCDEQHTVSRQQARTALRAVKQAVAKLQSTWMLFTEWPLSCAADGHDSNGNKHVVYVDCMLVLDAERRRMVAVEFQGTSHNGNPFAFGLEKWAACQKQDEADMRKLETLHAHEIDCVKIRCGHGQVDVAPLMRRLARTCLQDAENMPPNARV